MKNKNNLRAEMRKPSGTVKKIVGWIIIIFTSYILFFNLPDSVIQRIIIFVFFYIGLIIAKVKLTRPDGD